MTKPMRDYCPECKTPKRPEEMTTLPTSAKNVIRECCNECRARIVAARRRIIKGRKVLTLKGV